MREILFRGKRKDNGEWVYGNYAVTDNNEKQHFIFQNKSFEFEVNPKTVGQYTGLIDKNDKKIFEGDILKPDYDNNSYYRVTWDSGKLHLNIEEYCFNDSEGKALWSWCENIADYQINGCVDNCEIIGNIYDNPELLEVQK